MDNEGSVSISGCVERITYQNAINGYSVFTVSVDGEELTCVGTIFDISVGQSFVLHGDYINHPTYGRQFKVHYYENTVPEGKAEILKYLSSGSIRGVGPATARSIVEKFGDKSLEIIENSYEQIASIKGVSLAKAKKIHDSYVNQSGLRDIIMQLSKYNISPDEANKIYKVFGNSAVDKIADNPYCLFSEEIGFRYDRVNEIADMIGIASDSKLRISAAIKHVLIHNLSNGHTCLPKNKLLSITMGLVGCNEESALSSLDELRRTLIVNITDFDGIEYVFLQKYYVAERYISSKIKIMSEIQPSSLKTSKESAIDFVEKEFGIKYETKQVEAIKTAFDNGIFVLTGGPGTGKTTILKAIIEIFGNSGLKVELTAPTGRAAKRMTEVTGYEAKTIHRLLEVEWDENDKQKFTRNERNPLDCDVIIIDEMSMVDSLLFEALLRSLTLSCRIIMVGDSNQLPSVGAGNVLGDIIASSLVPVIFLTEIFRQAMTSLIVTNAHKIVSGENPQLDDKKNDMFMIDIATQRTVSDYIVNLCTNRLPKAYGYNLFSNIQILCPSKVTAVGSKALNTVLQNAVNPADEKSVELKFNGFTFRVGDKVMQTKNNYDIEWTKENGDNGFGVFNGDLGVIMNINLNSSTVTVLFDDRTVVYGFDEANQLELAYAVTIHKSQGSEFDCVILPIIAVPDKLSYRNLLYTAVTRAKNQLIIVGDRNEIYKMVANNRKTLRYTGLERFLKE